MKLKQSSQNWIPFIALTVLLIVSMACGASSSGVIPTTDPGFVQTAIVSTAAAAQLQTLTASVPEQTSTSLPTPTIVSTETLAPTLESQTLEASPTLEAVINGALVQIKSVNKEAEYVDLENIGNEPQDLTGWSLVSEKGNQTCNLGGVITAGATLRVWTNNPNDEGYNCNYGSAIWNNSELDPAVLYNNQGQEVARYP